MPPVLAGDLDPRNVARAIAFCRANDAEHHVVLLEAAAAKRLAYTALGSRLARPNLHALNKAAGPALVLLGDDDGDTTGPAGWVALPQLTTWARYAVIHGTGGDRPTYQLAISMAQEVGRLLLVETSSDAVEPWTRALTRAGVRTLCFVPSGGGVHPIDADQGVAA
jgi:hypothetical protein